MIDQTFLHLTGIGPVTEARIKAYGIRTWQEALQHTDDIPVPKRNIHSIMDELMQCQSALERQDIQFLIERLPVKEHWRILGSYKDQATYFDIETSGLSCDAYVTVVVCYHQGQLRHFVQGENLDDFLDILEDVQLLVSFNGASFDVPQLLRAWHIPELNCPHIDLRWQCYHQQKRGGLKQIETQMGIERPTELRDVDGLEAVWLWQRWKYKQDCAAREKLIRYCAADVVSLKLITDMLMQEKGVAVEFDAKAHDLWYQTTV